MSGLIGGQAVQELIGCPCMVDFVKVSTVAEADAVCGEGIVLVKQFLIIRCVYRHKAVPRGVRQGQFHYRSLVGIAGQTQIMTILRQFHAAPGENAGHGELSSAARRLPGIFRDRFVLQGEIPVLVISQIPVQVRGGLLSAGVQFHRIALPQHGV